MIEYLVANHLYGNYYVTTGNPDEIEAICESCFDRDMILASWTKGDKEAQYKTILPCCYSAAYLVSNFEKEEENYKAWLLEFWYDEFSSDIEYDDIEEDIIYSFERARNIASCLEENRNIESDVAAKLKEAITLREEVWNEISKTFDYSTLEIPDYKVLKKSYN